MSIARLYNFVPNTVIQSSQVNGEFDQLIDLLNGTSQDVDTVLTLNHATNPVLTLNQKGAGPIAVWKNNGTEKGRLTSLGNLLIGAVLADSDLSHTRFAINVNKTDNIGAILAALQTANASDIGLRIAMDAATSGGIPALQITKYQGGGVEPIAYIRSGGKMYSRVGYPSLLSNIPAAFQVFGGQFDQNVSPTGNVGGGEDDLHSFTILGYTLTDDGDSIDLVTRGTFASNSNNKTLKGYFAGNAIVDTGSVAFNGLQWVCRTTLVRSSSSTLENCSVLTIGSSGSGNSRVIAFSAQITGLDFTASNILKFTAQGSSDNDIVQSVTVLRKNSRA